MIHPPHYRRDYTMRQLVRTVTDGLVYGFAFAIGWFAAVMLPGIVVVI